MVGVGDLFGRGSIGEQFLLWNVLSSMSAPVLQPVIQSIANRTWELDPSIPVSPDVLAAMVNRGLLPMGDGESEARKSGTGPAQFHKMVTQAGSGPTLIEAIELWRRGLIEEGAPGQSGHTFMGALKDAGVRDEWAGLLSKLRVNKPTGEAALNALLQGQITRDRSYALWLQAGEDPDWFQDAFNSQGSSPTPDMLGTMANRKIIPWDGQGPGVTSFMQGFLEGPWRNHWEPAMRRLQEYLPPPRTVTAMVHAGSITDALALQLWEKEGLTPELATAYLADAHHAKATADKELTKSEIAQLYKDGKITQAQAEQLIVRLGYSTANAALILSLANVQKADTHVTAAINRVHALYVTHKITADAAKKSLVSLKVAADQAIELMDLWDIEIGINVKQLTPAQITAAWDNKIITEAECTTELQHLGYTAFDAWVLMSLKAQKPLPGKPAQGSGPGINP